MARRGHASKARVVHVVVEAELLVKAQLGHGAADLQVVDGLLETEVGARLVLQLARRGQERLAAEVLSMGFCGGLWQLRDAVLILHVLVAAVVMMREEGKLGWTLLCRCLEVIVLRGSQGRPPFAAALLVMKLEPALALEDVAYLIRLTQAELRHVPRRRGLPRHFARLLSTHYVRGVPEEVLAAEALGLGRLLFLGLLRGAGVA